MKASAIQCEVSEGDASNNTTRVCDWIEQAAQQGCSLVVLPECVLTGYGYNNRESLERNALPMNGPEVASVIETCRRRSNRILAWCWTHRPLTPHIE